MVLNENSVGMNNMGDDNDDSDRSDVEWGSISVQNSICRSTSSGGWFSEVGDETYVSSRIEYEQHLEELASKETRAVTKLKLLVFGSLCFGMVAVVLSAYFFTAQGERQNFEVHFYDDANKILGNMGHNVQRTMEAADAFIVSITSYAAHTNQTWPYVVIPDFAVAAEKVRSLCGAVYVNTYHVIENEERKEWENFTATVGSKMADEAIATIAEYNVMDWPITSNYTAWNVIYDYDEYDKVNKVRTQQRGLLYSLYSLSIQHLMCLFIMGKGEEGVSYDGPYLPLWQIQPTIAEYESLVNHISWRTLLILNSIKKI
jgi:hypothetical protein